MYRLKPGVVAHTCSQSQLWEVGRRIRGSDTLGQSETLFQKPKNKQNYPTSISSFEIIALYG